MPGQLAYIQFLDSGQHPDQGLPGGRPPRPGHLPARPGSGAHPDQGLPSGESPDQGLPEPPPGIWPPPGPSHPIVPLPPGSDLQPGEIWPPLPDHAQGKFIVLVYVGGEGEHAGWHYTVIDADLKPDQGLPGEGEEAPDQGQPPRPSQGLPRPPVAGQPRPPGSAPPRPSQGLPPTAQPRR